jgi:hypothetical protein
MLNTAVHITAKLKACKRPGWESIEVRHTGTSGLGLFATAFIPGPHKKNKAIAANNFCDYIGVPVNYMICNNSHYICSIGSLSVNSIHKDSCFGRYANDALVLYKINAKIMLSPIHSAKFVMSPLRDIQPGDEIYVSYGLDFWRNFKTDDPVLQNKIKIYIVRMERAGYAN